MPPIFSKPQLIIVEGADCTGKTTLAKYIARVLPAAYYHASGHKSLHEAMPAYHKSLVDSVRQTLQVAEISVVMDRHWPSEWCYTEALRPQLHDKYPYTDMCDELRLLGAIYIFCFNVNAREVQRLSHAEQDHHYQLEEYNMVYGNYKSLFAMMNCNKFRYDLEADGPNIQGFLKRIGII